MQHAPLISNIHRIVSAAYERGEQVFIVGNPEHPETIGINGHCGNSAILSAVRRSFESLKAGAAALWFKQRLIPETFAAMQQRYRTRISPHSRVQQHMQHNIRTAAGGRGIKQEMRCYACFR